MSTGKILLAAGFAAGVAGISYGEFWSETRNEAGQINGLDFFTPEDRPDINNQELVLESNHAWLEGDLHKMGSQEPWCSSNHSLILETGETVNICLDEDNLGVRQNEIIAFMRTEPYIPQEEGNPSLFLTFKQDALLQVCIDAKEEMRTELREDLAVKLGSSAVNYSIEIHVDPRNLVHPCDDTSPYVT